MIIKIEYLTILFVLSLCFILLISKVYGLNDTLVNNSYLSNISINETFVNISCDENFTLINNICVKTTFANIDFSKVEFAVVESLSKQESVRVFVALKSSSIDYSSNDKNTIKAQVAELQSKISPFLSYDNFKVVRIFELDPSFSGYVTERGLLDILSSDFVEKVTLVRRMQEELAGSVSLINADDVWNLNINGVNITGKNQVICLVDLE
ncbi:Uncharacterised protein [Candidatus Tiddalikarchaeum anstoanum]|nr:Uncharacterised protein [Candidatus Tiddalikarchaeum anstoanum]